jgi:hypothetical protein
MQHAPMTLPDAPANGVTSGLDWAQDDHTVAVVDSAGRQIQRFAVAHNATGLRELLAGLATAGVTEVAIERPDGTVVDALLAAGLTVVVISPNQLKNLRGTLRLGGQQGRPVRRLRIGRHATHRSCPAAAADPRQRGDDRAALGVPGTQGSHRSSGRAGESAARTYSRCSPARWACSPTWTAESACSFCPVSTVKTAPIGSPQPG